MTDVTWTCKNCGVVNPDYRDRCARCGVDPRARLMGEGNKLRSAHKEIRAATAPVLDLQTFQPVFATVARVPIVMAGVEYLLATGPATFTPEDIQDFVASQDDPAIVSPRLKIGHTSRMGYTNSLLSDGDDGVPALGRFQNITFDAQSLTAIGDIMACPIWMARMLLAGLLYPSRSIEGFQGAETVTGKTWGLVVHAVALLGCVWPGCSTLDDLALMYTEGGPDNLELYDEEGELIAVGTASRAVAASGGRAIAARARPVEASANVDDVRRDFYNQVREMAIDAWSWIRAIYLDPNELIVDDDNGHLYRVPFTTSDSGTEFSDPVEVNIQYVDAAAGIRRSQREARALNASTGRRIAVYASREDSRPASTNDGGNMTPEQLAALGLPANASAAQIHARLITMAAENDPAAAPDPPAATPATPAAPATPATPPVDEPEDDDEAEETATPPAAPATAATGGITPEAIAALRAAGLAVVPQTTLDSIQRDAATGATHAREEAETRRSANIAAAIREGRIRSADAPTFTNMYANTATAALADTLLTATVENGGLRAGLVPVEERGELPVGDATNNGDLNASYDETWLTPGERARLAAVRAGTYEPPLIQSDVQLKNTTAAQAA